jgi:tRNA/rRNA methyltransferase
MGNKETNFLINSLKKRLYVILVRPEKPENIGLAARAMKNTGFVNLRLAGLNKLDRKSSITAVHAQEILESARLFPGVSEACSDLNVVLASTSKKRKNFPLLSLEEAVVKTFQFPEATRIGILFGNEQTGLTSEELAQANLRFTIPQAANQPSYNLASAVLLTLFSLFTQKRVDVGATGGIPLPWKEQQECFHLLLKKLEEKKFIHETNRRHVTEMVFSLFGRLAMTEKDKKFLLAVFSKGPDRESRKSGKSGKSRESGQSRWSKQD